MVNEYLQPVNSLIFIDRYLFSHDRAYSTNTWEGVLNVRYFLEKILPPSLEVDFHVLIVFDPFPNNSVYSRKEYKKVAVDWDSGRKEFTRISKLVNSQIKEYITRPYNIHIELLSLKYEKEKSFINVSKYGASHNRRLLSNYYLIKAEHSLKVMKYKYSLYSQNISIDWYASKGFISNSESDYMGICMQDLIENMKEIVNELRREDHVLFSQNGEEKNISEIVNRLVK